MPDVNQSTDRNKGNQPKKDRRAVYALAVAGVIIVILLLLLLRSCSSDPSPIVNPNPTNNPTFDTSIDPNAKTGDMEGLTDAEIQEALNKQVSEGSINISMALHPTFKTGTSSGQLLIVNDESNRYPQVIEIYLAPKSGSDSLGDLLYKSGAIPVGGRIDEGTLLVDLEKGTYDCIAYFNAIDSETGELRGKAGANVTITVES